MMMMMDNRWSTIDDGCMLMTDADDDWLVLMIDDG